MIEGLKKWYRDLVSCKRCGLCSATCPTGLAHDWYASKTARGRMLLLLGLARGDLKPTETFAERLYTCTLCGYCSVKCPSGIKPDEIFLDARKILCSMGLSLSHIAEVCGRVREKGNPYGMEECDRFLWLEYGENKPRYSGKVAFWVGCTMSYRRPEAAANIYALLRSLFSEVCLVEGEECCGSPLYLAGDLKGFRVQLDKALRSIRETGAEFVVTPCPSCARSLTEWAKELDVNTNINVVYLAELLGRFASFKAPKADLGRILVSYHDPCETGRHMRLFEEPRRAITCLRGVKLLEMNTNRLYSNCCGGGGLYLAMRDSRTLKIATKRLMEAPADARSIITACPSCEVSLSIAAADHGLDIEVLDIGELWWRASEKR